jgi:hypothetical protein
MDDHGYKELTENWRFCTVGVFQAFLTNPIPAGLIVTSGLVSASARLWPRYQQMRSGSPPAIVKPSVASGV